MRQEFLEHLVRWKKEAEQRAQGVVSAKTNELRNELQLKQHLHAPRARRAEVDIHNVRAGRNLICLSIVALCCVPRDIYIVMATERRIKLT